MTARPTVPTLKPPGKPVQPTRRPAATKKTFSIQPFDASTVGQKIILYGKNGRGKSTLAALAPRPVFIPVDAGAQNIRHPVTGKRMNCLPGVENFDDMREAIRQAADLDFGTLVIDTITKTETSFAIPWTLDHVTGPKNSRALDIEAYGYGKGFRYLFDTMGLLLPDLDRLAERGKNILLLAQQENHRIANAAGDDYVCAGPNLSSRNPSTLSLYCEWVDHILRVDYANLIVDKDSPQAPKGKAVGDTTRAVFADAEVHFMAKSRQLPDGSFLPPVISFESKEDSSVWDLMFAGN
jgi:hypothetical protein